MNKWITPGVICLVALAAFGYSLSLTSFASADGPVSIGFIGIGDGLVGIGGDHDASFCSDPQGQTCNAGTYKDKHCSKSNDGSNRDCACTCGKTGANTYGWSCNICTSGCDTGTSVCKKSP
jgi:hypothetical protein